jgi:histidyl-tRNA synthetase
METPEAGPTTGSAGPERTAPPAPHGIMTTQPARGMRDFLPEDVRRRTYVIGVIREVYERYGFEPLETPALENLETLLGKYGEEGNKLIFKILKRGEHEATGQADLALRYDLTVPLARVVAEYRGRLPRFFRRYQVQPVWRADRPARGRFREFYQCDIDAIGSRSLLVEAEICAVVSETLARLGFTDFEIRLNHRQALTAMLEVAGLAPALHEAALVALDKLDKVGPEGVARELSARGIDQAAAGRLLAFFESLEPPAPSRLEAPRADRSGGLSERGGPPGPSRREEAAASNARALEAMAGFLGQHEVGRRALADLREILDLSAATPAAGRIRIDPSLARGLSYYTGAIMEAAVPDLAGSLGGGGRYDGLVGMFLGEDVPACGFSLGLERILVVMGERGMFPAALGAGAADVLVTLWAAGSGAESLALAGELRQAGLRVEVYPEPDRLGRQFRYAASRGVRFVAVVGDDERAQGTVTIKELASGAQQTLPRAAVADAIRSALERR